MSFNGSNSTNMSFNESDPQFRLIFRPRPRPCFGCRPLPCTFGCGRVRTRTPMSNESKIAIAVFGCLLLVIIAVVFACLYIRSCYFSAESRRNRRNLHHQLAMEQYAMHEDYIGQTGFEQRPENMIFIVHTPTSSRSPNRSPGPSTPVVLPETMTSNDETKFDKVITSSTN